jgi:DNA helicase-2/ATP-dependent DNA helicase PcrA
MAFRGSAALGRSVIVAGVDPAPTAWSGGTEIVVDEAAIDGPAEVVAALHRVWADREPAVIRVVVDPLRFRAPAAYPQEPWTLPPGFELWGDRLQFLVWANSYDARLPGPPIWWWGRKAARLGATLVVDGPGDVVLADGRPVWIDGGPRRPWPADGLDGAAIVAAESVQRGRLTVAVGAQTPTADLARDQLAAVGHPGGPARIIAPAGSGKTRVLTERLRHLIVDRGWERDGVLAVAYNKRAQEELDGRCRDFGPRTRTLNSLGLALITRAGGRAPLTLDERETRRIVERLVPAPRHRANTDPIGPYLEALGAIRLGLRDPSEVEESRDDVPGLAAMWPGFVGELHERHAVDFDQQIYGAIEVLLGDGEARATAQADCRHLLVDELQDLTPAHILLLRLLATPALDCFGVGDDDQVIYGHAGADPGFLIHFDRLFPGAADHPLEVNYRCPVAVVDAAATLLSYNHRRVAKVIRAGRDPDPASVVALDVRRHAAGAGAADLVTVVRSWQADGVAGTSMAVLARVNSMLLAPHLALAGAGFPVASVVRPDLLERTGLRAALAYLRIASAPDGRIDGRDIVEILRRPSRSLPPWFADRLRRRSTWSTRQLRGLTQTVPDKDAPKIERLVDDLVALRIAAGTGTGAARLLQIVRDDIGLGGAMSLLDGGRGGEGSSHVDDLEALEQVAALHDDPATLEQWIRATLERSADTDGITVSTVHRVKGMEWDRVALYGLTAGILPHRLAEDVEEERRVLHVAITRGRHRVAVLADAGRPSPFVDELTGVAPHQAEPPPPVAAPSGSAIGAEPRSSRPGRRDAGGDPARSGAVPSDDPVLEEALRGWRRERAGRDKVPAYIVFSDRTLRAIVSSRPVTLAALRRVDGIGPTKLELYGEEILTVVAAPPVGPATGAPVGPATGARVGPATGAPVGPATGARVGPATRAPVGGLPTAAPPAAVASGSPAGSPPE